MKWKRTHQQRTALSVAVVREVGTGGDPQCRGREQEEQRTEERETADA